MKVNYYFGHCEFSFESDSDEEYVHIYNLYIKTKYRRKGFGKYLIEEAINKIRSTGYLGEIQIVAIPEENSIDKIKLIDFYTKMGLTVYEYYD